MALSNLNPTKTASWEKLEKHFGEMKNVSMQEMFKNDNSRAEKFSILWNDFLIDYSKNIVNQETMTLLLELANEMGLKNGIQDYFGGGIINQTENRAVLHTALRAKESAVINVNGVNV
ncbi:MAG TPA: hypothetical protein VJ780_12570, partial [Flavobacterium sp.]|nr:hypothetical protein [Flavobacterium sp.]